MHRMDAASRLAAGALALWFGLVTAAPAVLHGCPRALAEAAAGAASTPEHHHHGAPTGQDSRLPQQCTCLGACATTGPANLAVAPALPAAAIAPTAAGPVQEPADLTPFVAPDHTRPFATAPPFRTA